MMIGKYQTLGPRIVALIIDVTVLFPLTMIGSLIARIGDSSPFGDNLSTAINGFMTVFYFILSHAVYGQTVGKAAVKVKVVNDGDESKINFNQAILRSLPELIPVMYATAFASADARDDTIGIIGIIISMAIAVFCILDVIVCLASEKRRALHDFIARTVVVKTDP